MSRIVWTSEEWATLEALVLEMQKTSPGKSHPQLCREAIATLPKDRQRVVTTMAQVPRLQEVLTRSAKAVKPVQPIAPAPGMTEVAFQGGGGDLIRAFQDIAQILGKGELTLDKLQWIQSVLQYALDLELVRIVPDLTLTTSPPPKMPIPAPPRTPEETPTQVPEYLKEVSREIVTIVMVEPSAKWCGNMQEDFDRYAEKYNWPIAPSLVSVSKSTPLPNQVDYLAIVASGMDQMATTKWTKIAAEKQIPRGICRGGYKDTFREIYNYLEMRYRLLSK